MPVELVVVAIDLIRLIIAINRDIRENYSSIKRLLERCEILLPTLERNQHLYKEDSRAALKDLLEVLNQIKLFAEGKEILNIIYLCEKGGVYMILIADQSIIILMNIIDNWLKFRIPWKTDCE
jgi:hypothetical protein